MRDRCTSSVTAPRRPGRAGRLAALAALLAAPVLAAAAPQAASGPPARQAGVRTRYLPDRFAGKAGRTYRAVFGVDELSVKLVESGELVRFSWRVLDAGRAGVLGDKRAEPALIDAQAGVSLVVPAMEKVGQLRQSGPPEAGKSYWMAFSNKGRRVKRGDRVSVVVGTFRADGLVVD